MGCSRITAATVIVISLLALASVYAAEETELAHDKGYPFGAAVYLGGSYGHMVVFSTPSATWRIQKVRIFGTRYGNQTDKMDFNIMINQWDIGGPPLNLVYSKTFPYSEFKSRPTWVDIDVGGVIVNRTLFGILVFTSSTSERGIRVAFDNSTTNEYSPGSKARYSRIVDGKGMLDSWDEIKIKFQPNPPLQQEKTNWMIRAVGVSLSPAAATSTTVKTSFPLGSLDITLQQVAGVAATSCSVILGWFFKTRKQRFTSSYLAKIESTYKDYSGNPQECKKHLAQMKEEVDAMLKRGKLDVAHFSILDTRIARYLSELE